MIRRVRAVVERDGGLGGAPDSRSASVASAAIRSISGRSGLSNVAIDLPAGRSHVKNHHSERVRGSAQSAAGSKGEASGGCPGPAGRPAAAGQTRPPRWGGRQAGGRRRTRRGAPLAAMARSDCSAK